MVAAAALLALLVLGVVVLERFGRSYAQGEIAARLREAGMTGDVDVTVGRSWWQPSILPTLVTGNLDRVEVRVTEGTLSGIPVEDVDYVLSGIEGDLSVLNGSVDVREVEEGSVRMLVPVSSIGQSVGTPLAVHDGRVVVGQDEVPATVGLVEDNLVISGPGVVGLPPLPLADPYILPCRPELALVGASLELACSGDEVPGILRGPLQGDTPAPGGVPPVEELPPPQSIDRPGG